MHVHRCVYYSARKSIHTLIHTYLEHIHAWQIHAHEIARTSFRPQKCQPHLKSVPDLMIGTPLTTALYTSWSCPPKIRSTSGHSLARRWSFGVLMCVSATTISTPCARSFAVNSWQALQHMYVCMCVCVRMCMYAHSLAGNVWKCMYVWMNVCASMYVCVLLRGVNFWQALYHVWYRYTHIHVCINMNHVSSIKYGFLSKFRTSLWFHCVQGGAWHYAVTSMSRYAWQCACVLWSFRP